MSVVAVRKYKEYIEICADGLSIKGAYNTGQCNKESCKLHTDKNYILGSVGKSTDGKLFDNLLKNNKDIKLSNETAINYTTSIGLLKEYQKQKAEIIPYRDNKNFDDEMNTSAFILIVSGEIFTFYVGGVQYNKEFDAIGAGQDEVLSDLINGLTPTEAVKKSAKSNIYISEPITTYRYYYKDNKIEKQ